VRRIVATTFTDASQEEEQRRERANETYDLVRPNSRNMRSLENELNLVFDGRSFTKRAIKSLRSILRARELDTLSDLEYWLTKADNEDTGTSVVTELLSLILNDTVQFVHLIRKLILDIDQSSANDSILQARLVYWRETLNDLLQKLDTLKHEIRPFVNFLHSLGDCQGVQEFETEMLKEVDLALAYIEKSRNTLRADMSLLENKRGIAQAESVGKLTELGFIFIPISCVASTFSMQIHELKDGVPLAYFFLVAVLTVAIAYAVRLTIRSSIVVSRIERLSESIRSVTGLPNGASIPMRNCLYYVFSLQWLPFNRLYLFYPLGFLLFMLPVGFIWIKRGLDPGFKVAIFCVLSLFLLFLFIFVFAIGSLNLVTNKYAYKFITYIQKSYDPKHRPISLKGYFLTRWGSKLWVRRPGTSKAEPIAGQSEGVKQESSNP
jgi:Mg2+ and Co2+ transporter CorA